MANQFRVRKGLIVNGSGSTLLDVQGSQGQLFSVTDSLSGSLFSVKDISGIPVLEAFSDNRVNIGTFNQEAIRVSGSFAFLTGSLRGTASWAQNAVNAASVATASWAINVVNGGGSITVADEGTSQGGATFLNFIGAGVTATVASNTASITIPGGSGTAFPYTGSAEITGSLVVTGSVSATQGFSGSLFGTASWAQNAVTASYVLNAVSASFATTASFAQRSISASFSSTASFAQTASYGINIVISGSITNADYIQFNTASSVTDAVGRLYYSNGEGTLVAGLVGGNVAANIGEDLYQLVYNASGAPLTKGQVVYVSGSQGNRIAVKLASATAEQGSANTLGLVAESIGTGGEGWIQTEGVLRKLNTTGLVGGQLIYLSSSAGEYTQTKPQAPLHEVRLGYAERIDATVGSIYIKIDNGYEIDELHNVLDTTTTSSYGDLFVKSGSLWVSSKQLTGSYGLTGSLTATGSIILTGSLQISGSLIVSNTLFISASSLTASISNPSGDIILTPKSGSINTGSVELQGGFRWKRTQASLGTEIGDLITFGGTMGLIEGGSLTTASVGGLVAQVGEAVMYNMNVFPYGTHDINKFSTVGTSDVSRQITLPPTSSLYVYYDNTNLLRSASTAPSSRSNVILGKVTTDATKIIYIDSSQINAHHYSNYLDRMLREALGPIFSSGGLTTTGSTAGTVNVSPAVYYFSQNRITTTGGTPITFDKFYKSSTYSTTGQYVRITGSTVIDDGFYDDGSGTLAAIPSGKHVKHALYLLGDNSLQATATDAYLKVYGQTIYNTVDAAEAGALPVPPSFFVDAFVIISSIVVGAGTGIQSILDERPRLSFISPSKTGVLTDHGDLSGLLDDDHPQYLLTDGTRTLTGDLNLGNNDIINVSTINATSITSSLLGTASWAQNALTASSADNFVVRQNLTVFGSSSIQYITSSQLNISTNIITVNTQNPTFRFGGLAAIDSGSNPQQSGSLLYDSVQDEWIFIHRGGPSAAVTSSHVMMGPETYNAVGDEIYIPATKLVKSAGNEHLTGSNVHDDGTTVIINSNTQITGSLIISASLSTISGSLLVTQGITGSLFGTASWSNNAVSSSFATTASYYQLVTGSSGTDVNIVPTPSGSIINIPDASTTARGLVTTGTQTFTGDKTFSGSINTINSNFYVTSQNRATSTATFALLGATIGVNRVFFDGLSVTIPSNQSYTSLLIGDNPVQESTSGVHPLIANVSIQPLDVTNGSATTTNAATFYIEGAAKGTATITNNYAIWVDSGSVRFDGDLIMSQSNVIVTGSVMSTGGFTGSLLGTASWAQNAVTASFVTASNVYGPYGSSSILSASFAVSASWAPGGSAGLVTKAGSIANTSFAGNPRKATVQFATPFGNTSYAVVITGEDARSWTIEGKLVAGFTASANSNTALNGTTYWIATAYGETT